MSYRAFKRLLGETSLERKCRFLFGTATLLLISASFLWYARQTEHLAYEVVPTAGRLLVKPLVYKMHEKVLEELMGPGELTQSKWEHLRATLDDLPEEHLPDYQYLLIKPNAQKQENQATDPYERNLVQEFLSNKDRLEESHPMSSQPFIHYYGAVRASDRCLFCHPTAAEKEARTYRDGLKDRDLMALVRIRLSTDTIQEGINQNRAWLLSTALVTAILIMCGSYLIVRYIIVKPVKHLKEVSDAISAGELNVRSEIQTGDEFEDLSHAFNRMLRNLVSMQDRLRKANADLDLKVDELAQVNMALYDSNRLKSDFLATMSHELRTPLNSIIGFSDVLSSGEPLTDKQQRWIGNIRKSGEQLLNLINDILDLAKIEAGKMQVRPEEFSIRDVCEGLLNMFRPMAEKKNIDLRDQIAADIPLLHQDAGKLQQILSNLLSNAIKFTPEGGRVVLKAESAGTNVLLTVADTGVGIAPEDQELVFEKFRQAGNPLTREHAGTGLGLSIVRELSKLLGGEVTLQSELGRGSTFMVRLPLQIPQEPRLDLDLAVPRLDGVSSQGPAFLYGARGGDGVARPLSGSSPEIAPESLPTAITASPSTPKRTEASEHLS